LFEQHFGPVGKACLTHFRLDLERERVSRVDFQNRLGRFDFLAGGLQQSLQIRAHIAVVDHDASRAFRQTMGHAHFLDLLAQRFLDLLNHILEFDRGFFLLFLLGFIFELGKVEFALGDRLQLLAFEFVQAGHHPLVDAIREQQHFDTFLAQRFEVRAVLGGGEGVGGDVVDRILTVLHARDVILQAHDLFWRIGLGRGKAQQTGDSVLIGKIFAHAFF